MLFHNHNLRDTSDLIHIKVITIKGIPTNDQFNINVISTINQIPMKSDFYKCPNHNISDQMRYIYCLVLTLVTVYTHLVDSDQHNHLDQDMPAERHTRMRGERVSFQCDAYGEGDLVLYKLS